MLRGALSILPLAFGAALYGFAFGVLAAQAGLVPLQVAAMGALVYAGSSQIVAVEQFASGAGVASAVLAGAALNLRYLGIVAAVAPLLSDLRPALRPLAVHLSTDENFALTMATRRADPTVGGRFLVGSGAVLCVFWCLSTTMGAVLGAVLPDLERFGLGFAFTAAFIAMAHGLWSHARQAVPWACAFVTAFGATALGLPPAYAIVAGAGVGLIVTGVVRHND